MAFSGKIKSDLNNVGGIVAVTAPVDERLYTPLIGTGFQLYRGGSPTQEYPIYNVSPSIADGRSFSFNEKLMTLNIHNLATGDWTNSSTGPELGEGRVVGVYGDTVYVFGKFESEETSLQTIFKYIITSDQWIQFVQVPAPLFGVSTTMDVNTGIIYIYGGHGSTNIQTSKLFTCDVSTSIIAEEIDFGIKNSYSSIFIKDSVLFIVAGNIEDRNTEQLFSYDLVKGFKKVSYDFRSIRTAAVLTFYGDRLILMFGKDFSGKPSRFIHQINPNTLEFVGYQAPKAPSDYQTLDIKYGVIRTRDSGDVDIRFADYNPDSVIAFLK